MVANYRKEANQTSYNNYSGSFDCWLVSLLNTSYFCNGKFIRQPNKKLIFPHRVTSVSKFQQRTVIPYENFLNFLTLVEFEPYDLIPIKTYRVAIKSKS